MTQLEYLNLENNLISFIESHSFLDLINLETLILSLNKLSNFNDTFIFSPLSSLKYLNLSSNQIELIQTHLFKDLFKLETLDLSLNRIRLIQSFGLNHLLNLRNLHLNENDDDFFSIESNTSMFHLDSIQNIFISKSILNNKEENVLKFLSLFEEKTKRQLIKRNVLGISFFKSLFLTSKYDSPQSNKYDCNLTLFFIRKNVHFNFKTETEIFDYFSQCSLISIKNTALNGFLIKDRNSLIFKDFGVYFFWLYLLCVLAFIFYLLITHKE